ncbi:unnamed protein product, partial [Prunus brigantina]
MPRGVIEDVLVQVDKFYYPVDFVVLDTQPILYFENEILVILERPFLATCNAHIICRSGVMKLSFGNMTLEINIFNVFRRPYEDDKCAVVNLIEDFVQDQFEKTSISEFEKTSISEPLKALLLNSKESELLEDPEIADLNSLLNSLQWLLNVLNSHISVIGWTLADIKRISPLVCTHKIFLEDKAKSSWEAQRSDYAVGAVLGQRKDKKPHVIHYASRTLNSARMNHSMWACTYKAHHPLSVGRCGMLHSTTEKELLAVVFALDKFRAYIVGSPIVIFTDHASLKYLFEKKDAKA